MRRLLICKMMKKSLIYYFPSTASTLPGEVPKYGRIQESYNSQYMYTLRAIFLFLQQLGLTKRSGLRHSRIQPFYAYSFELPESRVYKLSLVALELGCPVRTRQQGDRLTLLRTEYCSLHCFQGWAESLEIF